MDISWMLDQKYTDLQVISRRVQDTTSIILLNKRCLLVSILFSWRKSLSKKVAVGGLLNMKKFKTYNSIQDSPNGSQPDVPIVEALPLHTPPLRKSSRVHNVPLRYGFIIENDNTSHIIENDDLTTYSESIISSDFDKWLNIMKSEMDSIYTNQVCVGNCVPKSIVSLLTVVIIIVIIYELLN